ncbi:cupin domain-containing protein [Mesorhizobium sp. M4A.F.Ca.ET.020.02.1.1]|uniref:cupin domain-containing protein n=1 Tax=unclassified Mesorhizobium TaxID=325217 RepID=UPI000FCAA6C0|nr:MULTISPECIES: cupin domain-containing protein [unclassified Mesorhizobium]RUX47550.1 cupin domain-containing protein [Mesorhizobium sp. M4A.F.Ca.ET.050.02.1.1]RVD43514.1 cupin domain-containing protein [Mesorhizobium sp. M4A.F.Ca.ET.020.02.1.1]RWC11749.1 MAG: cupin domain-containing protein [Mesorhizobium sp.]RWD36758.1 MAG: cupin domain-containing protein [Mesorhizobium sp.]TIT73713.1 MAG: cupin domain-containing protein [Mesorhizobium sp.]
MDIAPGSVRAARTVKWMDTVYRINVGRYQSGGIVSVFESIVPSRGGPPVHVHHNEDEVIHVIEGTYEFWLDGQFMMVPAGASIFLPCGVPHTFRVASAEPGRNLTILTPGGLEEFFVEAAARELAIPDQMTEVAELASRYGIEFRGPAKWVD